VALIMDFKNTEIAFVHKTNWQLKKGILLFKSFNFPMVINYGPKLATWALNIGLPVKGIIKKTMFGWFCGGESIDDCQKTILELGRSNVGTMLDYSVEGEGNEKAYEETTAEFLRAIKHSAGNKNIHFSIFKSSGIVNNASLQKLGANEVLTEAQQNSYNKFLERFDSICQAAAQYKVRVFVDAEESWLQDTIDDTTYAMMEKYNTNGIYIYNTIQLYRHDRLEHLKTQITKQNYLQGYKLVRGAYLEKENLRAEQMGYPTPIQPNKEATDRDYDEALKFCIEHINKVSFCAGTHNEQSIILLTELMKKHDLAHNHQNIWFAQLLGMSDNVSFNLASVGYNAGKYVPYGPVQAVLPYLARRAQENSSIKGQMGRELALLQEELERRRSH